LAFQASTILEFFDQRRERGEPLVLATVYETQGSTYSKAGEHMLIDADGVFRGMLSGGCLEGDLAARARVVIESGRNQTVTYDLAQDDELWGIGVGCDGLIRVLLQALTPENAYAPFTEMAEVLRGGEATEFILPLGDDDGSELVVLVEPPPAVLVLGAGLDAVPVVRFAAEMGWRVTVADHRPAYIESGDFPGAEARCCVPADDLGRELELARFDMAIVMSHHLASDRSYLRALANADLVYVGLLGPRARRERLLSELGDAAGALADRLHGPAGIDIGGRGPAPIALSIVAEMQKAWASR
jgi:xanthine/CO dehydrogenase XdhC/CoxF family maturation factor